MGIVTLPNSLSNGQPFDANEPMANFNAIISEVNGNIETANIADASITNAKIMGLTLTPENVRGKTGAFQAYLSANEAVVAATPEKIEFDAEDFDADSTYDKVTNFRWTPTVPGYYQVGACLGIFNSALAVNVTVTIKKNGTAHVASTRHHLADHVAPQFVTCGVEMNGTDYLEVFCTPDQNITVLGNVNRRSYFYGFLVGTT